MIRSRPSVRIALGLLACAAFASLSLLCVSHVILPSLAYLFPSLRTSLYDHAAYGIFPEQAYRSFSLASPAAKVITWNEKTCSDGYVLAALNGPSVTHAGPSIFTSDGQLVWTTDRYGIVMNLRLQQYAGSNVLTFWAGEKAATSGRGAYYILGEDYGLIRRIDAVGEGLHGDLHEFSITPENTGILTVYNTTSADLSGLGWFRGKNSWLTDSLFQEIKIDTGELLFQWSAAAHFDPKESYMGQPFSGFDIKSGFDSFHINAIDKHAQDGDYLVSSRHTHTISLIDGRSGDVLWILGGEHNEFVDLSADNPAGGATEFAWQHDARFVDSSSLAPSSIKRDSESKSVYLITLFDNQKAGPLHQDASSSRALLLRLDTNMMTAEILQSYSSSHGTLAGSQGSVQIVPASGSGNDGPKVIVGWGASAMYTQHDLTSGDVECEVHFAASSSFPWERVKSYRMSKISTSAWHGRPRSLPAVKVTGRDIYVSWNGATEVVTWEVYGRRTRAAAKRGREETDTWFPLSVTMKNGFEDMLKLPTDMGQYTVFHVVAVDILGGVLGTSESFKVVESWRTSWTSVVRKVCKIIFGIFAASLIFVAFLMGMRAVIYRLYTRRTDGQAGVPADHEKALLE